MVVIIIIVIVVVQPSLPTPFYSVLVSVPVFMAHSAVFFFFSFHKFSRQLSVFSLCSSGLSSALLVLSTIYQWSTGLNTPIT